MLDEWSNALDSGFEVDAAYLDFAKAFDSVPFERFLIKLQAYGINGKVHQWLREYLEAP